MSDFENENWVGRLGEAEQAEKRVDYPPGLFDGLFISRPPGGVLPETLSPEELARRVPIVVRDPEEACDWPIYYDLECVREEGWLEYPQRQIVEQWRRGFRLKEVPDLRLLLFGTPALQETRVRFSNGEVAFSVTLTNGPGWGSLKNIGTPNEDPAMHALLVTLARAFSPITRLLETAKHEERVLFRVGYQREEMEQPMFVETLGAFQDALTGQITFSSPLGEQEK